AAAFLGCLLTATLPVLQRRALVSAADLAVVEGRGADRPLRLYQEAARVDPLSAVPYRRAAEFCFARWAAAAKSAEAERQEDRLETLFRQAVQFMNEAIRRNPLEAESYATLADWYLAKFEHTKDSADAAVADSFLATACARYPSNVRYWARRAVAANLAGRRDDARRYAKEALRLDAINRHAGHVDKFLSQTVLGRLRELAE
ncbi:MAG: hypothetical protein GXP27_16300, partial [Planctomycetes bacterium]|nr:hypothetical protein [Planctomycetota bacterium]